MATKRKSYWNNKEKALKAVQKSGINLFYLSDELKNDKEVVLAAVQETGLALRYASESLKNDKEIVLKAVQENGSTLPDASPHLRCDKEVVLAAIKSCDFALLSASSEIQRLLWETANPVATLQSIVDKEKLEAKFCQDEKANQRLNEAL